MTTLAFEQRQRLWFNNTINETYLSIFMQYIMSIVIFMDHLYILFLRDMFILHIYIINHIIKRKGNV